MDVLRRAWGTPRVWRYIAVGAVMFTIGGMTTAVATSMGLTQIIGNAGGFVAGVNSNHEVLVNDGTANTALSGINSKLGGTLTVGGSVSVSNNPAGQALGLECNPTSSNGFDFAEVQCPNAASVGTFTVPTGKLLVIQDIGVTCLIETSLQLARVYVGTPAGQVPVDVANRGLTGTFASLNMWTGSQVATLYVPAGTSVPVGFTLSGAATGSADSCDVNIEGGLVPA